MELILDDTDGPGRTRLRRRSTEDLAADEIATIRALLAAAFWADEDERFTDDDWAHSLGGVHVVLDIDGEIVCHASVVERELHVAGQPLRAGYVEAVATAPEHQRRGYGSTVMREVTALIEDRFELGALGTGVQRFYERLGWRTWLGPSGVRTQAGHRPTPDDDGYIMVLRTPTTPPLDREAPISCEWRPGDVW